MDFDDRAKSKIEDALRQILNDATFEIKRNPEKKDEIEDFCRELIISSNGFFRDYKNSKSSRKRKSKPDINIEK